MSTGDKLIEQMRRNPRADWHIDDFKTAAKACGIAWRSPGGSHVIFVPGSGAGLSVPARRPIKPIYVRLFVAMIDRIRSEDT